MGSRERRIEKARSAIEHVPRADKRVAAALAGGVAAAAVAGEGLRRFASRNGEVRDGDTAYRLLDGEAARKGLRRVALARADDALAHLGGATGVPPAEAIHEARKDIKKIRAVIRLVRDELGDDLYRAENQRYRDIGRGLSGLRDSEVLIETLDGLEERFGDSAGERFSGLRERLEQDLAGHSEHGSRERALNGAAAALKEARSGIESWPLETEGWALVAPGIHRTYRRGRKRLRDVQEEPTDINLHEWRKRVKDLWYQMRLVHCVNPEVIGYVVGDTDGLADHLGDDHDLALLAEATSERAATLAEPGDRRALSELIDRRRGELQFAALSLGMRVYRDKPKRFLKGLEQHWSEWESPDRGGLSLRIRA
ncbi:MAG TPA: CHAD domain-containing protein [Solirubrobacterales bacterium]|nr:CHAD domain-containing protein [Solirubrobacterales bacterium]